MWILLHELELCLVSFWVAFFSSKSVDDFVENTLDSILISLYLEWRFVNASIFSVWGILCSSSICWGVMPSFAFVSLFKNDSELLWETRMLCLESPHGEISILVSRVSLDLYDSMILLFYYYLILILNSSSSYFLKFLSLKVLFDDLNCLFMAVCLIKLKKNMYIFILIFN